MADEKRSVILDINVDATDAVKQMTDLLKVQEKYRKELAETQKKLKDGTASQEDLERIIQLKGLIAQTTAEYKKQEKQLGTNANSLNAIRARVAEINKEFQNIDIGTDRFNELQAELNELNGVLIGSNKAANQFKENIGNYPELFRATGASISGMGDAISALKKQQEDVNLSTKEGIARYKLIQDQIEKLTEQQKKLTDATKSQGDKLTELGNSFQIGGKGVGDFAKGLAAAGKAALANPYVLLATALATLVGLFAKSKTGQELMARASGIASAALSKLAGFVESAVLAVKDFFSQDPAKIFSDIGKAIQENVMNRIAAFSVALEAITALLDGDFSKAALLAANAVVQFNTGITNATGRVNDAVKSISNFVSEADLLSLVMQRTTNAERLLAAENAKMRKVTDETDKSLSDANLTFEKRKEAIEEAIKVESNFYNTLNNSQKLKLSEQNIDEKSISQWGLRLQAAKKIAEQQPENNELQQEYLNILYEMNDQLGDSAGRLASLREKLNGVTLAQRAYYQSLADENIQIDINNKKANEAREKDLFERIRIQKKIAEEEAKLQKQALDKRLANSVEKDKKEIETIGRQRLANKQALDDKLAALDRENRDLVLRENLAAAQSNADAIGQINIDIAASTRDQVQAQIDAQNKLLEAQRDAAIANTELTENERFLIVSDTNRKIQENTAMMKSFDDNVQRDKVRRTKQANMALLQSSIDLFTALGGLGEQYSVFGKVAAVSQAIIDGILAVQATLADRTIPSTTARIALAVVQGATAALNVAKIVSVETPKSPFGSTSGGGGGALGGAVTLNNSVVSAFGNPTTQALGSTAQTDTAVNQSQAVSQAVTNAPAPVVKVTDINRAQSNAAQVTVVSSI